MRTQNQQIPSTAVAAANGADQRRLNLVRRRSTLEARLLAHRCGWRTLDDLRLRRLERSLKNVLKALGGNDPAVKLIRHGSPQGTSA